MLPAVLMARSFGRCGGCSAPINPGDEVIEDALLSGRWMCYDCGMKGATSTAHAGSLESLWMQSKGVS